MFFIAEAIWDYRACAASVAVNRDLQNYFFMNSEKIGFTFMVHDLTLQHKG